MITALDAIDVATEPGTIERESETSPLPYASAAPHHQDDLPTIVVLTVGQIVGYVQTKVYLTTMEADQLANDLIRVAREARRIPNES